MSNQKILKILTATQTEKLVVIAVNLSSQYKQTKLKA